MNKKAIGFPKRIIILGASGFIGKMIFKKFSLHNNIEVKGFSSQGCNLLLMDDLRRNLSDLTLEDVVIVTAAITRLKENTFDSMVKNIEMAGNLSKVLLERPLGQLIFLSTVDVYGIHLRKNAKISERLIPDPDDYYATSKIASEFLLRKVCVERGIPLTIMRLCGVYGPGDKGNSAITSFISRAFNKKKVSVYGSGENLRDYVYVDDIYKVASRSIEKRLNKTINIATGKSHSVLQIVKIIKSLFPQDFEIEFRPMPAHAEKRIENMVFDCSLLKREFPDLGLTSLEEGVANCIPIYFKE
jgi:nucleoside-diphosphate-sugar epimerase